MLLLESVFQAWIVGSVGLAELLRRLKTAHSSLSFASSHMLCAGIAVVQREKSMGILKLTGRYHRTLDYIERVSFYRLACV